MKSKGKLKLRKPVGGCVVYCMFVIKEGNRERGRIGGSGGGREGGSCSEPLRATVKHKSPVHTQQIFAKDIGKK